MRDLWSKRYLSVILGGAGAVFLPPAARIWVLGLIILLLLRLWLWRPQDFSGRLHKPEILLLAAGVVAGFVYGLTSDLHLPRPLSLDRVSLTVALEDWRQGKDYLTGIVRVVQVEGDLEISSAGIEGRKYVLKVYPGADGNYPEGWKRVQPGDELFLSARLEQPQPSGVKGGFDRQLYYAVRGLSGSITAKGDVQFAATGNPPAAWRLRRQVKQVLSNWETQDSAVLEGILFGDSGGIEAEVQERYRKTGVLHIFAASGSNVAFVLVLVWGITRFFPLALRIGLSASTLVFYAVLCGGSLPVVRASVLGIAALFGYFGKGRVLSSRFLYLAAGILFVHNPLVLKDVGFQLSFAAAWGIIVLSPRLAGLKAFLKMPSIIRTAAASTLAAQIATLPILMTVFHRLSLVGLFANLGVLFAVGAVFELGIIGVMFSFSPVLAAPFFQASFWLLHGVDRFLAWLAAWPWAEVLVLRPSILFWLLWYGGIGIWLWGHKRAVFIFRVQLKRLYWLAAKSKWGALVLHWKRVPGKWRLRWAVIIAGALLLSSPWVRQHGLEVTFLDVGQGDAIIIRTPEDHTFLIDSGPQTERFDSGERIIVPYLLNEGIGKLDALMITHEHEDHIGGAKAVLNSIPVGWIGVPDVGERLESRDWQENLLSFAQEGKEVYRLQSGDKIELDSGAFLEVLAPAETLANTRSDPNNNSLVLKLNYQGESVLLTGDMETEEMKEIAETGQSFDSTFFKQPHHGSKYSLDESWLEQVHPQAVIISVGKNSFGHPAPEVLRYWQERQVPVYRTDEDGSITLHLDDKGAEVSSVR
ncbi:DNA internalization-related competence protein ComEC/Rec2 [Paradesulfitobacterium ferrireducens]|uniref:DNA internalization-related competence protein ComEC/Rec2 n=1 Tax=Paradesulfitobacterium ferrireducens TaxID=2816476 RepID=UPI001A8EE2B0|nr:DNA internalization-related competence protein ComEC/Rec2 [Paradesulfitobacterium ferrireducens]